MNLIYYNIFKAMYYLVKHLCHITVSEGMAESRLKY